MTSPAHALTDGAPGPLGSFPRYRKRNPSLLTAKASATMPQEWRGPRTWSMAARMRTRAAICPRLH
jgi:hypothetical protein